MDVVSDSEEAAGGNEDPGPTNDREMKRRREGERRRDRGIRYFQKSIFICFIHKIVKKSI